MKSLCSMLLLLLVATGIAAQSQATNRNPPDVVASHIGWETDTLNIKRFEDPLYAAEQQAKWQRETIRTLQDNAAIARSDTKGLHQRPIPPLTHSSPLGSIPPIKGFSYSFKLRNSGGKKIVKVIWEYVFLDPATKAEAGRQRFTTTTNIRPGKSRYVMGWSTLQPVKVVDATMAGRKAKGQYSEDVIIQKIEYGDGSVWIR